MKKTNFDFSKISFNGGLFVKEMQKRGINVRYIKETNIIFASYKNHREIAYDIHSGLLNYPVGWIINDKFYSKKWLELQGISVASGCVFSFNQLKKALLYAGQLGFPVVLKPAVGSHGDGVFMFIDNKKELAEKIKILEEKAGNGYFLIEKQVEGNEYRLFLTRNGFFAAVERVPANVIGDGKKTLLALIQEENFRRMNPRNTCLCEIRLDALTFDFMDKNNLTLDDIPKKDKIVFVRGNSNVSTGGNCYDVTDLAHPTVKALARQILKSFPGLPYIGVDLLCGNISKKITKNNYTVCELNSAPGLSLHMMPEKGIARDVAGALVDLLFPESSTK